MIIIILCWIENEDILTINEKELQDTPSNASLTVNVYPFGNKLYTFKLFLNILSMILL